MKQSSSEKGLAGQLSPLDNLVENDSPEKVDAALRRLIALLDGADPIRRAIIREASIKKLEKIGVNAPAKLVDAAFQMGKDNAPDQLQGRPVLFDDPEPWPDVVNGSALLDEIALILKRFLVLPLHAAGTVALWVLHACALEAFTISPLLVISSPTKRSGKTRLLKVISYILVKRLFTSNITPAALFRVVDKYAPCLLIDEADTFVRDNPELRGILNSSHEKAGAFVVRTVGDEHTPAFFITWCAKAIALIGKLPDTLEDRSILIPMKRRRPGEAMDKFRFDKVGPELTALKRKIMRWTADNLGELSKVDPEVPGELNDRAADNWRPLFAVAELAKGQWPGRSRAAARALSGTIDEGSNSAAIQILTDLKDLFDERDTDRLSSSDICETLGAMEDRPWPEWKRGKPITVGQLAKLLAGFEVRPSSIRIGDKTPKGYTLAQFDDPFARYVPSLSETTPQSAPGLDLRDNSDPPHKTPVADEKAGLSPCNIKDVADVADQDPSFPDFEGGASAKPTANEHKFKDGKWTHKI